MSREERRVSPPEPPEIQRRFRLHGMQWVGVPLLLGLPPILALFGVFGESWTTERVERGALAVRVEWPTRFRYKMLNDIRVRVENRSAVTLDTVTVALDAAYAARFSTVRAIPAFDAPFTLSLVDIPPGGTAMAMIEIQAEQYGRHSGDLTVAGIDTARIRLHTTIFP